jgi:fructose-1-phosphate kinase PfkB-like protein
MFAVPVFIGHVLEMLTRLCVNATHMYRQQLNATTVVCHTQLKSAQDAAIVAAATDSSYTDDGFTEARLYRAAQASAVVDCTGAGDCLAAAVAHGESLGMPIAASVQIGLVCAARSVASAQVRCVQHYSCCLFQHVCTYF